MFKKNFSTFLLFIGLYLTNFIVTSMRIFDTNIVEYICDIFLNVKPSTRTSISGLTDAMSHYKGGSGKTVRSSDILIAEMKSYNVYQKMLIEIGTIMRNKITDGKIINSEVIKAEPNSSRGLWCLTLGSYNLNINYAFYPTNGWNTVKIHFSGYDTWDFVPNPNASGLYNFIEETLPEMCAGKGTAFNITYDFYDEVTFLRFSFKIFNKRSEFPLNYTNYISQTYNTNAYNISRLYTLINYDTSGVKNLIYLSYLNILTILIPIMFWQTRILF